MRATAPRPGARLISVRDASREYGLPEALLRDLARRGEVAAVSPPGIRRVFLVRADIERRLESWRVAS